MRSGLSGGVVGEVCQTAANRSAASFTSSTVSSTRTRTPAMAAAVAAVRMARVVTVSDGCTGAVMGPMLHDGRLPLIVHGRQLSDVASSRRTILRAVAQVELQVKYEPLDRIVDVEAAQVDQAAQPVPVGVRVDAQRRGGGRDVPQRVQVGLQGRQVLRLSLRVQSGERVELPTQQRGLVGGDLAQ